MQGALGGLVVLVLAVWGKYVFNRLWQRSLMDESVDAMAAAQTLGLTLQPVGYGPRVKMVGDVDGVAVSIWWCGGLLGASTLVQGADGRQRHPLLRTKAELRAALFGEE